MTVYQVNDTHVFIEHDFDPTPQEPPSTDITTCRDTTREALEILLGMNSVPDAMADSGMEGPSTGEAEPEIITAARNLRLKLEKEGIL